MIKTCFVTVETTGLDFRENGLIQLCCIMDIDGKKVDRFNSHVKTFSIDKITKEALQINGISKEDISSFLEPQVVFLRFKNWLEKHLDPYDKSDKFHFIGYNARFVDDFLRGWFRKNDNLYYGTYFYWPAIDITNLIAVKYMRERKSFKNFQLKTVAKKIGITDNEDTVYNAESQVKIIRDLYYKMFEKDCKCN